MTVKQDIAEQTTRFVPAAVGVLGGWTLAEVSVVASIFSYTAAGLWAVVQLAFLLRKWWRLEKTNWGREHADS